MQWSLQLVLLQTDRFWETSSQQLGDLKETTSTWKWSSPCKKMLFWFVASLLVEDKVCIHCKYHFLLSIYYLEILYIKGTSFRGSITSTRRDKKETSENCVFQSNCFHLWPFLYWKNVLIMGCWKLYLTDFNAANTLKRHGLILVIPPRLNSALNNFRFKQSWWMIC